LDPRLAYLLASSTLVGAIAGYVTNLVAVWMLFHPYKPVRIPLIGVKLQGLLPAKKDELAERLGEVVEEYLKSADFRRELERGVREALRGALADYVSSALSSSSIASTLLAPYIASLSRTIAHYLVGLIPSRITEAAALKLDIKGLVVERVRRLEAREIEEFYERMARRELRMIKYAGLILGALIGPLEALLITMAPWG